MRSLSGPSQLEEGSRAKGEGWSLDHCLKAVSVQAKRRLRVDSPRQEGDTHHPREVARVLRGLEHLQNSMLFSQQGSLTSLR